MISSSLRWGLLVAAALLQGAAGSPAMVTILPERPLPGSGLCLVPCAFVKNLPPEMFSYGILATMKGYGLDTQICGMQGGYVIGDALTSRSDLNEDPYNSLVCGEGDSSADGNYPCYIATGMVCGPEYGSDSIDEEYYRGSRYSYPPYDPQDVPDDN
eukprot:gene5085-34882_t